MLSPGTALHGEHTQRNSRPPSGTGIWQTESCGIPRWHEGKWKVHVQARSCMPVTVLTAYTGGREPQQKSARGVTGPVVLAVRVCASPDSCNEPVLGHCQEHDSFSNRRGMDFLRVACVGGHQVCMCQDRDKGRARPGRMQFRLGDQGVGGTILSSTSDPRAALPRLQPL